MQTCKFVFFWLSSDCTASVSHVGRRLGRTDNDESQPDRLARCCLRTYCDERLGEDTGHFPKIGTVLDGFWKFFAGLRTRWQMGDAGVSSLLWSVIFGLLEAPHGALLFGHVSPIRST